MSNTSVTLRLQTVTVVRSADEITLVQRPSTVVTAVGSSVSGPVGPQGPGVATGGTTSQFLVKNSGTNYDTAWSSALVANSANVTAATAASVPVTINGAPSQTGNLTEWKNSSGGVLASLKPTGMMAFDGATDFRVALYADTGGPVVGWGLTAAFDAYGRIDVESGMLRIKSNFLGTKIVRNDDGVVVAVQGVSGQTNDLQQWQNSAGTVLARVTSSGEVRAALIDGGSA